MLLLQEIVLHERLAVGHGGRGRASLRAAPVAASLFLVLVKHAARAAAAHQHEEQEDEHHGGQDDANNAADANGEDTYDDVTGNSFWMRTGNGIIPHAF